MRTEPDMIQYLAARTSKMPNRSIFMCRQCGCLYDESRGDPDRGIEAGTDVDELPDEWRCPECGADKSFLEQII